MRISVALRRLVLGAAMTAACWGCTARSESVSLCMPEEIADGVLVRIDRRSEAEHALTLVRKFEAQGLRDPVAAVYEFSFMRNKPLFHFVLGSGAADRASLLDHAIATLGGTRRRDRQPTEHTKDGAVFLCVDFTRGRGLVGLSGACAFSDGGTAGYGVRTDGGDASDTLKYTAEARRSYLSRAARRAEGCPDVQHLVERAKRSTDRDGIAREIVAAIHRYDCKTLAGFFQSGSEELFREQVTPVLRERRDPGEWVCFVLGTLGYPQSETMRIEAVEEAADRALLEVSEGDAKAELALVREGSSWKLDREWAVHKVQNHRLKQDLTLVASTVQQSGAGSGVFTDDPAEITRRTHIVTSFQPGLATRASNAGDVHLALGRDRSWACISARSRSGEFFLIRVDRKSWGNARLQTPPDDCPSRKLGSDW